MNDIQSTLTRREQILQTLSLMLADKEALSMTTANLARQVGVSEAALYRHFPSKISMFSALFDTIDSMLFGSLHRLLEDAKTKNYAIAQTLELFLQLILTFAERNPGLCRLLITDLQRSDLSRLSARSQQVFDRIETQIKQLLREAEISQGLRLTLSVNAFSRLLNQILQGRFIDYWRSQFHHKPTTEWVAHWSILSSALS